jgi:hypothetical protein
MLEQAAVATLRKWAWPSYIEEVERQNGLAYGTLQRVEEPAIRGAADLTEWMADELPVILVVVEKPTGEPQRFNSAGYVATYPMTVGAITLAATEDEEWFARRDASLIIAACMGAIGQELEVDHPGLVVDMPMADAPWADPVDPDLRTEWQGTVTFDVIVNPVFNPMLGLATPTLPEQAPTDYPEAQSTDVTVDAVPIDESISD